MAIVLKERPLDLGVLTARLQDFLNDCVGSAANEEMDRIREAGLLLQGMPMPGRESPDVAAIEAMLGCGAVESAVLAIVGPDVSFMLSRSTGGSCLATVVAPDETEETIAEGATIALALLAAHASSLLARLGRGEDEEIGIPTPPSARFH